MSSRCFTWMWEKIGSEKLSEIYPGFFPNQKKIFSCYFSKKKSIEKFLTEKMLKNWQNKLKDYVTETDDVMVDLRKNLQMYNAHRDRVSGAYRERMDEINRDLNFTISLSQNLFVCAYSSIFIKLIIFTKYKRFNPFIKFSMFSLFCLTLEPLTLASCRNFSFWFFPEINFL